MIVPSKAELFAYYNDNDTREAFHTFPQQRRLAVIRDAVQRCSPANPVVLDVGCGDGYSAGHALEGLTGVRFVGVEYSFSKLTECRRCINGYVVGLIGDGEILPLRTSSVDLALCFETMEHLPNPAKALAELRRVLKPEGRTVLTIPLSGRLQEPLVKLYHWLQRRPPKFAEHLHFFTRSLALQLIREAGFTVLEAQCHGFEFFGLHPKTHERYARWDTRMRWFQMGLTGKPERWQVGHTFLLIVARPV